MPREGGERRGDGHATKGSMGTPAVRVSNLDLKRISHCLVILPLAGSSAQRISRTSVTR